MERMMVVVMNEGPVGVCRGRMSLMVLGLNRIRPNCQ